MMVINGGKVTMSGQNGASYDGSKTNTELDRWFAQLPDPESFIKESYNTLASRGATLYNTSPFARAVVNKPLSYVIGDGVYYQCLPDARFLGLDTDYMKEWAMKFTQLVHYDKLSFNYYEKQRILLQDASIEGDSCLWFDRDEDGYIKDLIATGGHIIDSKRNDIEKNIVLGIETDSRARRDGLYLVGNEDKIRFRNENGTQNVIQVFMNRERAGQIRGYGVLQSAIALYKNADTIWDATLQRMIFEAVLFAQTKSDNVDFQRQFENLQKRTVNSSRYQKNIQKTGESFGPSVSQTEIPIGAILNADQNGGMEFNKLETPSNNFQGSQEWVVRLSAMNRGYAPEFIRGEYPTSYSAGQGAINDSMRVVRNERRGFTRTVEDTLHYNLAIDYMRSGELDVIPGFFEPSRRGQRIRHALLDGKYMGPIPGFRNPLAEAKADQLLEADGVLLKSERIWKTSGATDFKSFLEHYSAEEEYFNGLSVKQQEQRIMDEQNG